MGSIFTRHSFARAFLTFPVAHPRIFSLGFPDSNYVEDLNHALYGMEAIVTEEECWERLDLEARSVQIVVAVEKFYNELSNTSENRFLWNICFSVPITKGLPRAILTPLKSETPAYFCKDEHGNLKQLEREKVLVALVYLCSSAIMILTLFQVFLFPYGFHVVAKWGVTSASHLSVKKDGTNDTLYLRDRFFSELHIPVSVSVGGIICAEEFLGQKVMWRLKILFVAVVVTALYAFIPIYAETNVYLHSKRIPLPQASICKILRHLVAVIITVKVRYG